MDRKIISYQVVPDDMVQEQIKKGYQPFGSPIIESSADPRKMKSTIWQAMVVYENSEPLNAANNNERLETWQHKILILKSHLADTLANMKVSDDAKTYDLLKSIFNELDKI